MRPPRQLGRCLAPGSMGRHVYGRPDEVGVARCDCGACTRIPASSHLLAFLRTRLFADPVLTLEQLAAEQGIPLTELEEAA